MLHLVLGVAGVYVLAAVFVGAIMTEWRVTNRPPKPRDPNRGGFAFLCTVGVIAVVFVVAVLVAPPHH